MIIAYESYSCYNVYKELLFRRYLVVRARSVIFGVIQLFELVDKSFDRCYNIFCWAARSYLPEILCYDFAFIMRNGDYL